jgi:hypothetical protein
MQGVCMQVNIVSLWSDMGFRRNLMVPCFMAQNIA